VPRTVLTTETDDDLDMAWIRDAMGFADPLGPAELRRFTGRGGGSDSGGAAPQAAPASPPRAGGGPEGGGAPSTGAPAPEPSEDAFGGELDDAAPMDAPAEEEAEESLGRLRDSAERARRGRSAAPGQQGGARADRTADGARPALAEADGEDAGGVADPEAPRPVLSDAERAPRFGKILVQNAEGGYDALVPRDLRVVTYVEGPRARTVVDVVFHNPHDRRLQGTFYYPLPDGAAPAAFGMFPGTKRVADPSGLARADLLPPLPAAAAPGLDDLPAQAPQTGGYLADWRPMQVARVVEQKRARQVYEDVVRSRVDPALLEWSGANTFKARVFPLEPRGLKRVVLAFEQTLPELDGAFRWTFPLPGDARLGAVDAFVHVRDGVEVAPGALEGGETASALVDSAEVDGWRRHRLVAAAGAPGAFDLAIRPPGSAAAQAITGPVADLNGQAFYARVVPEVPIRESSAPTGRALFLVDTSLSEEGLRRTLSGELLMDVLERDATIAEYAVCLFDVRARWLHAPEWRANTPEARAATAAELEKVYLEGATNFGAALAEVERQAGWIDGGDAPATRFLLSDGLVTWGNDRVDGLLAAHEAALAGRWLCYRFGDVPVNRDLFDALARETAGRTVNVLTAEQLPEAAVAHRRAPVLLSEVRVAGRPATDLVVAGQPRLVFPGQALEVAGRLLDAPSSEAALEVVLEVEGRPQVTAVPLTDGRSVLAPRAWAELWVRSLLALDDERLDRMVVALSQAFGLANRSASLLILEAEQDWVRYDLEEEQVDLSNLMQLRAAEEDQRRDRLQGIALDDVPREGRDLVRRLAAAEAAAFQPALPLLDRPLAGGAERIGAEVAYRSERAEDAMDVKTYDRIARARAMAGDTFGAIRALSCLVEQRPRSAEANRLVGYACLSLGQYEVAAELFERVRLNRPFEPQSYLEEALALEAAGDWGAAARNYEILWARAFPRHDAECKVVGAYHYARMLGGLLREGDLAAEARAAVEARRDALQARLGDDLARTALQCVIHWNTDSTDIDLWVLEPEGERCYYQRRQTAAGGKLFWDNTTGYGPELYRRRPGGSGRYDVLIHFYGNNSPRLTVPTSVLLVRDRDVFGPEDAYTRRFQVRLLPKAKAVLHLRKETF